MHDYDYFCQASSIIIYHDLSSIIIYHHLSSHLWTSMLSRILTISHPPAQWPHGCSLPGQLGRGAQLREVQKVVLEDEPRKDGPFEGPRSSLLRLSREAG